MTDSEASAPQDDSDEDIYKDFPEFNLEEELAKLEGSKESYKQEALDLSEKVKLLTEENKELKRLNEVLGKNISTLLKTAQNEVHRKDSVIEELRSKVDSFTFRRSKRFGKDKFTTTEDLEPVNNFKSECLECKKNRDKKRSKSYENRTSSESESRSSKGDTRKSDRHCTKEENKDCDNDKRLGHFRDNLKLNFRHSGSDHDSFIDKQRGSQFNRYSRRESIVGRRSYRQDDRHHSKFDFVGKREYTKRDSNESRFSLRRRDSDKRKESRRDDSPEKPSRRGDTRRNRSRSRNRTAERKESSLGKGKRRGSLENDSLIRNRPEIRNRSKESESTRNSVKSDEGNRRTESSERPKVSEKSRQVTKDRNSVKSEGRRNPDTFETKSPLDALYNEMIVTRSTTRLSSTKSGSTKADSEIEEGECVEEKFEKSGSSDGSEEWTAVSKNEKPVTLYSKRMMEKISAEQSLEKEKEKESKETGDTKGDNVSDEKEASRIEEKNVKDSVETERESGELTDDENLIESSKEFQEIAKVASSVDNEINKRRGKDDRKKIPEPERVFFKEPFKTGTNNSAICNNIVTETNETRDIIEFSPFKNNYKLIEISPVKPSTNEHILDVYNKRLPSNPQTQKEVESKIFNLIMTLSGTPSDSHRTAEKTVTEGNEAQEISANREEHQPEAVENPETGRKMSSNEKTDERKHESGTRRANTRKSSKSKQGKAQDKPEKGQEKGKGETKMEDEVVDSVTPGETTQFLDFFLRTTSPSKPIVPAEQEMNEKQENGRLDSREKESEAKENPTTVVNTSSEKESLNGSSGEIQGKEVHSKTKSPKSINSKSKKGKSPLKKRNSNSKEDSKERETGETKREKPTESKRIADQKNGSSNEASRGGNKRKGDRQDGEKESRDGQCQKRKRTMSQRDEGAKRQKLDERKTCQKKGKRDSRSELEEGVEETVKEDITSFEFFKPITKTEKNGGGDANKSAGDYKMTTTMSLTGVVCLETPNKCVEKLMINEQAIYHFMDSKANATHSPLPCSKYPEMTPRRMLKNDLTLTDSDDSTIKPNQDEVDDEEAAEEEEDGQVEMSENDNSDSDSDSGASAFVDLL